MNNNGFLLLCILFGHHGSKFVVFSYFYFLMYFPISNKKFQRLGGSLDEIVTFSIYKFSIIMSRRNVTSFNSRACTPLPCRVTYSQKFNYLKVYVFKLCNITVATLCLGVTSNLAETNLTLRDILLKVPKVVLYGI